MITGGTGYIGSHTALNLLQRGYDVLIIDSNINSSQKVISNINFILKKLDLDLIGNLIFNKGDIRDYFFIENIFKNCIENNSPINAVIHFAGLKSVAESKIKPLNYWDVNVAGTINLLKIMEKYNCKNLIFSSSACVYGEKNKPPFKESLMPRPVNPYAKSKLCVETILEDFIKSNKNNWRIINLRYFNPIGSHHSGLLGEDPLNIPNNIFPLILNAYINKEKLFIFGNDWPTKDGTCIRDYIHVEDVVEGHIKALESNLKFGFYSFNLGTGQGTSVLELIKTFEKVNNIKIKYKFSKRRDGDTAILIADNSLAKKKLNWYPQKDLCQMCKDGFNWITKNPNGYN